MKLAFEGLLKYSHDVAPQDTYERCVLCGKKTDVPIDLPIDRRDCYVEGSGQLCRDCWRRAYGE
jgi:recombinational DNA repair protein (RecF pathway)